MQTSKHIFLIGFMGSGKTYWGKKLSRAIELPFLDLDDLISSKVGKSIADFFQDSGEAAFRNMEVLALQEISRLPTPHIIATGGGTPCFFDNLEYMNKSGTTIYLKVSPEILVARLRSETNTRPLLKATPADKLLQTIQELLKARETFYTKATFTIPQIDTSDDILPLLIQVSNRL
ncbi:MAG: hypothetical protein JNN28_01490 [Saprospiraceae bacterium]|nr:hypothetical protein [Saprospiraceae bacterium]